MMAEQNTLYLMLKEQGLAISFELFNALCDKAKEAAKEAVEQERKQQEK